MGISIHVILNETYTRYALVKSFPCAECSRKVTPKPKFNEVFDVPVLHGLQYGKCAFCQSQHFIISARTEADCLVLKPMLPAFIESMGIRVSKLH